MPYLIATVSLVLGLSFNYFFYEKAPGVSLPLFVILIIIGLFALAFYNRTSIHRQAIWLFVPLLFFSAMVFVRESTLLTFLNIAASLMLLLLIAKETPLGGKIKDFLAADYISVLFLPFSFIRPLGKTLSDIFVSGESGENKNLFWQVVRGAAVALPFLFIFALLFSSADLVFHRYVINVVDIEPETLIRLLIVITTFLIFVGAYSYIFASPKAESPAAEYSTRQLIGRVEMLVLLGSVNLLFLLFIAVQLAYLFGGENNISVQGFTYAEYARRGFFELIAAAVVLFLLLWTVEKYAASEQTEHSEAFKMLSSALVAQAFIVMYSAFTRLLLYEEAYGFTELRLYSHAFIFLLAGIFLLLLYKIYIDKRENIFVFSIFVFAAAFLVIMNALNPDVWIARQNIERFQETGKLDVYYLSRLSDDAILEKIKVLDMRDLYREKEKNWQSLHLSRMRARTILEERKNMIEE